MGKPKMIMQKRVPEEWIDANGHVNDTEYVRVFSWSVDTFIELIGLTDDARKQHQYTMFTLENHVCYLNELNKDESFEVYIQILDYDEKRIHVFCELYGENEKRAATSEQMLMGVDESSGRAAAFPKAINDQVQALAERHTLDERPKEAGRVIGIRRK